jgi:hypothetical protein
MRHNPNAPMTDRERDIATTQHAYELAFPSVEPLKFNYALTWLRCAPLGKVLETIAKAGQYDHHVAPPLRSPQGYIFTKLKRYQAEHEDVGAAIHFDEQGQRC